MKHRAVIFDLFGTLVLTWPQHGREKFLARIAADLGLPVRDFMRLWEESRKARETGAIPGIAANFTAIGEALGKTLDHQRIGAAAKTYQAYEQTTFHVRHDAEATLRELKRSGRKLTVVSDCGPGVPKLWQQTPLAALVEAPVFSCHAGFKKPDPRIYRLACERLGVRPDDCLYVGDGGSRELTGAASIGMDAVRVQAAAHDGDGAYQVDVDDWQGPTLSSLAEVLTVVR